MLASVPSLPLKSSVNLASFGVSKAAAPRGPDWPGVLGPYGLSLRWRRRRSCASTDHASSRSSSHRSESVFPRVVDAAMRIMILKEQRGVLIGPCALERESGVWWAWRMPR